MIKELEMNATWYEKETSQKWNILLLEAVDNSQLTLNHMLALCSSLKRRIVVYVSEFED